MKLNLNTGALDRNRTRDQLFTKQFIPAILATFDAIHSHWLATTRNGEGIRKGIGECAK